PRCAHGGAADRVNQRIVLLQQIIADDHAKYRAIALREIARGSGKLLRPHIVGWYIHEIAREEDAFRNSRHLFAINIFRHDGSCSLPRPSTALESARLPGTSRSSPSFAEKFAALSHSDSRFGRVGSQPFRSSVLTA